MPEPRTRSLPEIVDAIETTIDELDFQIMRLDRHVEAKTMTEEEYFPKLREGYSDAKRWLGILYRYQKGRMERQRDGMNAELPTEGVFMDEET